MGQFGVGMGVTPLSQFALQRSRDVGKSLSPRPLSESLVPSPESQAGVPTKNKLFFSEKKAGVGGF